MLAAFEAHALLPYAARVAVAAGEAWDDRHPVPDGEVGDQLTHFSDLSGNLAAGDRGQGYCCADDSLAKIEVDVVDAAGPDFDQDLQGPDLRVGHLMDLQDLGAAVFLYRYRSQTGLPFST